MTMITKACAAALATTGMAAVVLASPAEARGVVRWGPHGVTAAHVGPHGAGVYHAGYGYRGVGYRHYPYGVAAAGLAVGTAVGVAASRPTYYPAPVYYPAPAYAYTY